MKNLCVFDKLKIVSKSKIHKLVKLLSIELNFKITSLEISFINAEQIHTLNNSYLNHDYSTDIITFDYSNNNIAYLDGEIFISVDDAIISAKKYKVKLNEELGRLVIHGILHLLNFNDQKMSDKIIMKRMENRLLYKYKFVLL
ncbi:MAG: rRNA maturation RNase YbeY [Ignavibacteriaceae bacterium]